MNKNIKLASVITLISLIIPICVVLLIETSRLWVLSAPLWLIILNIVIAGILDKLFRNKGDNYKTTKFFIQLGAAILTAVGMYLIILSTR